MRRLQLFEFGDLAWTPRVLRDGETAYLSAAYRVLPLARIWARKILTVVRPGGHVTIVDLCSGCGGPMPIIVEELQTSGCEVSVILTDLYPNPGSICHPKISWWPEAVDAACMPAKLTGMRTMFAAFHHFREPAAKAILKHAFDNRQAICIFEAGSKTFLGLLSMLLVPLNVLALMPFARPFRWPRLILTYLIPLLPLMVFWDGVVSSLRLYSPEQMREMTQNLQALDYAWEIGLIQQRGMPGGLSYLIGHPVH